MVFSNFKIWEVIVTVAASISALFMVAMLAGGYNALFDAILQNQLAVQEGSQSFEIWATFPIPIYFRAYFFNITNPDEFVNGAKPILEEIGPYTYRQYETKEEIRFNDENDTISYYVKRIWVWDEDLSNGNLESDIITLLNPMPLTSSRTIEKHVPRPLLPFLLTSLNNFMVDLGEELILHKNVSDILFQGFEDPILTNTQEMFTNESSQVYQFFTKHNLTMPETFLEYDKFAWFYMRNGSIYYDGRYNMYTGASTLDDIGKIDWWEYMQDTSFYDSPCNEIKGSAGEMFPPYQTKTSIDFYSTDVCMTMTLYFEEEIVDRFDIPGYKFLGSNETFTNGTIHPGNECYCNFGKCAPTGLLNVENCRLGSPAFISFPHFLYADPYLLEDVIGLSPNDKKHSFFITLNPDLGTPMEVAARMQLNLQVTSYPGNPINGAGKIDMLENVPDVILPLFWFEMLGGLDEEMANDIKPVLFLMTTVTVTVIFSVILAVSFLIVGIMLYRVYKRKQREKLY